MPPDSVDEIIRAWRATDPDLDASPLEVVGRLLLCARHLERKLADALEPLGLSFADFDVLNTLRRRSDAGGTNPRELSRASLITSGAMTARLDRLERAGLIERAADPADRRGVRVRLTRRGERLATRALRAIIVADESFLAPLDRAQREQAASLLRALLMRWEDLQPPDQGGPHGRRAEDEDSSIQAAS